MVVLIPEMLLLIIQTHNMFNNNKPMMRTPVTLILVVTQIQLVNAHSLYMNLQVLLPLLKRAICTPGTLVIPLSVSTLWQVVPWLLTMVLITQVGEPQFLTVSILKNLITWASMLLQDTISQPRKIAIWLRKNRSLRVWQIIQTCNLNSQVQVWISSLLALVQTIQTPSTITHLIKSSQCLRLNTGIVLSIPQNLTHSTSLALQTISLEV